MMNVVRSGHAFSYRDLLHPARSDVPHLPAKKPIPTGGDTSAKPMIFRPIPPSDRTTKDWTAIAWPTNIQSGTSDGQFGPAKGMDGWNDCWFLAVISAMANDPVGHQILAESIKKVNGGYDVTFSGFTFAGSPNHSNSVFISEAKLKKLIKTQGGDADTRLMELAADKFFKIRGNYKSLFIATFMSGGMSQERAEQCYQDYCQHYGIRHPMTINPMRSGSPSHVAFFMIAGIYPDSPLAEDNGTTIQRSDVMRFLNQYVTNGRDGASVVMTGGENPLGNSYISQMLVTEWDVIRTDITSNGTVDPQQQAFLNAIAKCLGNRNLCSVMALRSAAGKLTLEHIKPASFVTTLALSLINMNQEQVNLLRSGVEEVLAGGPGYIGFPGGHAGTIEGINEATNTFAYSEPNYPTLVHSGELSRLIEAIRSGNVDLAALPPATRQDEAESSHTGEQRGRHLRQIHQQVVRDGKIDPAESGPIANLMEMEDGAFWRVYDSDKNGRIETGELKDVQLRVDRWVDHFKLTPIW